MKALFKYPRTINGTTYEKGERELPDQLAGHWFFKALVKCGDAELIEEPIEDAVPLSEADGVNSHAPSASVSTGQKFMIGEDGKMVLDKSESEEVVESEHTATTEHDLSESPLHDEAAEEIKPAEMREEDKQKIQGKSHKGNAHNSHKKRGR